MTQLKELRRQQQMLLEKKMLGEDSDEGEETDTTEGKRNTGTQDDDVGCTWGMGKILQVKVLRPLLALPLHAFHHAALHGSLI